MRLISALELTEEGWEENAGRVTRRTNVKIEGGARDKSQLSGGSFALWNIIISEKWETKMREKEEARENIQTKGFIYALNYQNPTTPPAQCSALPPLLLSHAWIRQDDVVTYPPAVKRGWFFAHPKATPWQRHSVPRRLPLEGVVLCHMPRYMVLIRD